MPAPIAMVVMMMGRARLWQASSSASKRLMPCSRRATMAYSTSRMEFLVAIPISMIRPISEGIEKLVCAIRQRHEGATHRQRQRAQDGERLHESP